MGKVFSSTTKVYNIQSVADEIRQMVPDARIVIGHGQMDHEHDLEAVMHKFIRHEADILVSTTIIESGIDIPNANTMFINEAENFGLADHHQLRGRVGRYKHRAYCYLLLSPNKTIKDQAAKRLKAMEEYASLGAGFKIALRDLRNPRQREHFWGRNRAGISRRWATKCIANFWKRPSNASRMNRLRCIARK